MTKIPYGGTTPDEDRKIEACVSRLMKEGKDKTAAIKICKSSVMKRRGKRG